MRFRLAVLNTAEICAGYSAGLGALSGSSAKVSLSTPRHCEGSVDIDQCLRAIYPNDNRWDYAVGYDDHVYFIEVHPASTSDVSIVLNKLSWLRQWLDARAPELKTLQHSFHWLATGGVHILPSSPQARKLAISGLKQPRQRMTI